MFKLKGSLAFAAMACAVGAVSAADFYVAADGQYDNLPEGAETSASLDAAIAAAGSATDTIYVEPGEYTVTAENGPNLKARLIGRGATREAVVITAGGDYRALRMQDGALVTNVTLVGNSDFKVSLGGTVHMAGGVLTDCVIRGGTATTGGASNNAGGNIYCNHTSAVIENCLIAGGQAKNRGGNVCLDQGTLRNCTVIGGIASGGSDNSGGNVWTYQGKIEGCTLTGGTAVNGGNAYLYNGSAYLQDCTVANGTAGTGGNVYNRGRLTRCVIWNGNTTTQDNGGGVRNNGTAAVLEDCLFVSNRNVALLQEGASKVANCTFAENVSGAVYGYGSASKATSWVNCVFFHNYDTEGNPRQWRGDQPTAMSNCAFSDGGLAASYTDCLYNISADCFVDVAKGDFRLREGSALIDAGAPDPRNVAASATDLDGKPRQSGTIDIGCYEFEKQELTVHICAVTKSAEVAPATVTFTHAAEHSAAPGTLRFTYDFGDGSEPVSTTEATVEHVYAAAGCFTVTVTADNTAVGEAAEMSYPDYVRLLSPVLYVTPGNTASAFPYDTPETGYARVQDALADAVDGNEVRLGAGVHEAATFISITKALSLKGMGAKPDDVIIRNTGTTPDRWMHRTLELDNEAIRVENLTLENGCVKNQNGANLRLVKGVVSNCVIRAGRAIVEPNASGEYLSAGGGVEIAGPATLTHCVITNNVVEGTSSNQGLAGGAVFITYGVKNARLSNSLIAFNRYVTSGDVPRAGAAGIRFGGSNDNVQIENNTIVANVVEGELAEDSAGVYCTTWYGRLRNNIIAGNYETGKAKYTSAKIDFEHCTFLNNLTDDAEPLSASSLAAPCAKIFKNFDRGDFRLRGDSPAVNAATPSGVVLLPSVDLAGKARIFDKTGQDRMDIGCYECQMAPGFVLVIK